jgi:hypothetical protein
MWHHSQTGVSTPGQMSDSLSMNQPYWGRGDIQSLSPPRREVWREVYLWSIDLKIALYSTPDTIAETERESLDAHPNADAHKKRAPDAVAIPLLPLSPHLVGHIPVSQTTVSQASPSTESDETHAPKRLPQPLTMDCLAEPLPADIPQSDASPSLLLWAIPPPSTKTAPQNP